MVTSSTAFAFPNEDQLIWQDWEDEKPLFTCSGQCDINAPASFHGDGYLKRGELKRLLHPTPSLLGKDLFPDIKLFKHTFPPDWFQQRNYTEKIIFLVRQNLSYLEFQQGLPKNSVFSIKNEMRTFLKSVSHFLHSRDANETFVAHLRKVVRHTGHFNNLKDEDLINYFSCNRDGARCAYHHFLHLSLDVRWTHLVAAHTVEKLKLEGGSLERLEVNYDNIESGSFVFCLRELLLDLVALSTKRFKKINPCDYVRETPFWCNCVRELWIMVSRLTDAREQIGLGDSFWVSMRLYVFELLLKDRGPPSNGGLEGTDCEIAVTIPPNPANFSLWLLTHISGLYRINLDGEYSQTLTTQMRSNYFELSNILKILLKQESVGEIWMRCYVRCCSSMCDSWEPSTDVSFILWDHFFKRLGEPFTVPGQLEGSTLPKSISSWFDAVKCRGQRDAYLTDSAHSSFQLFLGLLGRFVSTCRKQGAEQDWTRLKGRIFSKFHAKKVRELNPNALGQTMDLFLTLDNSTDSDEMIEKLVDVVEMLDHDVITTERRKIVWKSLFVSVLLRSENGRDVSVPLKKLATDCEKLLLKNTRKIASQSSDPNFTDLMSVYLDGLQEVFDLNGNFTANSHLLLVPGLSVLLYDWSAPEYYTLITMLQNLLFKLQSPRENLSLTQRQNVANVIWTSFLPVVKDVVSTCEVPDGLADIASTLLFLIRELPPRSGCSSNESLASLFGHFATCAVTRAEFCCRFVSNALSCDKTRDLLAVELPDYQETVIRVWVLCAMQSSNDGVRQLGRVVLKLSEVTGVFSEAEVAVPTCDSSNGVVVEFFKALGLLKEKKPDFRAIIAFRNKVNAYVNEMSLVAASVLKNQNSSERVKMLYSVVGYFFKYCAHCAYVKAKANCELSATIQTLLLPRIIYDEDKEIPDPVLESIQDTLHLFVAGLSCLDVRKDPFVARTLKDIFVKYLPRFAQKLSSGLTVLIHPLIVCLSDLIAAGPETNQKEVLWYTVEVIRDNYLTRGEFKTEPTLRYNLGVTFLKDVATRCSGADRAKLCSKLVWPLLNILFETDSKTAAKDLIQTLLRAANTHCDTDAQVALKAVIKRFLEDNLREPAKAFKVMEVVAVAVPGLIAGMLSDVAIVVNRAQQIKGDGADEDLRKCHKRFLNLVGTMFAR